MCSPGRRGGDVRYLFEGWNNNLNNPMVEIFTRLERRRITHQQHQYALVQRL